MDDKKIAKYIERIEIKGLWGQFDVDWKLHEDVNLLFGENGTGKTVILTVIHTLLNFADKKSDKVNLPPERYKHESMIITFKNGQKIIGNCKKDNYQITGNLDVSFSVLKTFDNRIIKKTISKESDVQTSLDVKIEVLLNKYVEYQLRMTNQIVYEGKEVKEVFQKRTYFLDILDELFAPSRKKVVRGDTATTINFKLRDKLDISPYMLSSGEKQMLILLLTVLIQEEKPTILLLDEPEISMHIRWQHELINILRTFNPNCQLIIVTHSPSIFSKGHRPRVFWIEDILNEIIPVKA